MINRGEGFTPSEKYLKMLCDRTFLSLWSYTNVFREAGKELCDLLVVVGDDVIIFSDKDCHFPNSDDINKDWARWFNRAIESSAKQLWGAEKWIRKYPDEIFLDSKCTNQFPIKINVNNTRFHLILVAHGASYKCRELLGSNGSLIFDNKIKGLKDHTIPFVIGDLDPNKTFIHILDDFSLSAVLQTRDTVIDFIHYLTKKEKFVRSDIHIISAGEEEMLVAYLKEINGDNEHDFVIPDTGEPIAGVYFESGGWDSFMINPQRIAQLQADNISYMWDGLIEAFSKHALSGTQYKVSEGGFVDSEKAIRFLALESRFSRRFLSYALKDMILKTKSTERRIRVCPRANGNYIAFLLLPFTNEYSDGTYDKYRFARQQILEATCLVVRLKYPDAKNVIGIAMESGVNLERHSEDLLCFDCSQWDDEIEELAKKDQQDFRILLSPQFYEHNDKEYPDVEH